MYVFRNNAVNLTCHVRDDSNFAVVWHAVDKDGNGTIVGKCFNCPSEETCSVQTGMDDDYKAMKEGDTYTLTIINPSVPHTNLFGYFQCGYQEMNCGSVPRPISRLYLFQSAIVFVYDLPSCSSALTPLQGNFLRELTCTWTPRFYIQTENNVKVELTIGDTQVKPDLKLPHGIVKRNTVSGSPQELEEDIKNARCTIVLSGKLSKSCNFSLPLQQDAAVLIKPLNASVRAGTSQNFYCDVQPNATVERSWEIFQNSETSEKISTSTRSRAGDVTFSMDTKESLLLKPRTGDTHYFIECSVNTVEGRKVSAFASVQTLGEEYTPIIPPTAPAHIVESTSVKPEGKPVTDSNMVGTLVFITVPIVLIIVFFVIGFVIVRKRSRKRTFKQPPRMMEVNYSNMGSNDNMVSVGKDDDGDDKNKL